MLHEPWHNAWRKLPYLLRFSGILFICSRYGIEDTKAGDNHEGSTRNIFKNKSPSPTRTLLKISSPTRKLGPTPCISDLGFITPYIYMTLMLLEDVTAFILFYTLVIDSVVFLESL